MKALITYGGWQGHEPGPVSEILEGELERHGFEVVRTDTLDALLDADVMADLDLIVPHWTMSQISGEQW